MLQETSCLPVLPHVIPACTSKKRHLEEMNIRWNAIYRKIFKFNQWESIKVRCFLNGLWCLDFHHMLLLQQLKFYEIKLSYGHA